MPTVGKNKKQNLIELESLAQAAQCLRVLAHPHRRRMVQMLPLSSYSVGELAYACEIPSNMASEHLKLMQLYGLLSSEKDGRQSYYKIAEPHLEKIMDCIHNRFG